MYGIICLVDEAEPLLDYILIVCGNQSEILNQRRADLRLFLQKKIEEHGAIKITKMAEFLCAGRKSE